MESFEFNGKRVPQLIELRSGFGFHTPSVPSFASEITPSHLIEQTRALAAEHTEWLMRVEEVERQLQTHIPPLIRETFKKTPWLGVSPGYKNRFSTNTVWMPGLNYRPIPMDVFFSALGIGAKELEDVFGGNTHYNDYEYSGLGDIDYKAGPYIKLARRLNKPLNVVSRNHTNLFTITARGRVRKSERLKEIEKGFKDGTMW